MKDNNMRKAFLVVMAMAMSLSLLAQQVYVRNQKIVVEMVGQQTVLAPNGEDESYFSVSMSPDRQRIAYSTAHHGAFVCDLNGKNVRSLGWLTMPMWMDNEMVAGTHDHYEAAPDAYQTDYLCVSRDGKMRRDLTEHEIAWLRQERQQKHITDSRRNFARVAAKRAVEMSQAATEGMSGIKIYLNAGHGGYDKNDRSVWTINVPEEWTNPEGYWESKSNLVKALALRDMLEAVGATVIMSRTTNNSGSRDIDYYTYLPGTPEYDAIMGGDDRDLAEIAEEANANEVDHFLSIHSNAVNYRTNYLLMLYHGETGKPTVSPSDQMAAMAGSIQINNPLTVWNSSAPRIVGDITFYGDAPTSSTAGLGVLRPLTVPGHLSEGSFHDYPPETHRLMNKDYCKLEALRMFQYFHKWFNRQLPQTACISGWVKSSNQLVDELGQSRFYYFPNTDDQWLPLNGATVVLKDAAGVALDTVVTDDWYNGVFAFYDLTPGQYILTASKGGYVTASDTISVVAEEIAAVKFRLPYTRVDVPDFAEPDQDGGTLLLPDYTFVKSGEETALDETFKRVLYRNGKLYALDMSGVVTERNRQMQVVRTLAVPEGVQFEDLAFSADGYLFGSVQASDTWIVYRYDATMEQAEKIFEQAVTGAVTGALAVSASFWKATLWTTTPTSLLKVVYDEDSNAAMQVEVTQQAGLTQDTRLTLMPGAEVYIENTAMRPAFMRYAKHSLMAMPESQQGKIGFRLWDMTGATPVAISDFCAMSGAANRAHAYAYVDGYVMHVGIVAEGLGVQEFVTDIPEVLNIYAAELNFADGMFAFRLNEDALSATLEIEKDGKTIGSTELGALARGAHEISNPFTTEDFDAYQLTVSALPVSYPVLVSDDSQIFSFATPIGVAVDHTPNSPYFGRIYVTNAEAGAANGRSTTQGVYVLSSDFEDVTAQGNTAYDGSVKWGDHAPSKNYQLALARPCVAPDGSVFVPSATAASSGVYVMDPSNPSGAFTAVFDGKRNSVSGKIKNSGNVVANPVMHCVVTGTGAKRTLYTMDHDISSTTLSSSIWRYDLGDAPLPWGAAPSAMEYNDQTTGKMQNGSGQIALDGRGGWWLSQYRYTSTEAVPALIHVTGGKIDLNVGGSVASSQQGGMAVTKDGNVLAIGRELGTIAVYAVAYNSKGKPALTERNVIKYGENREECVTMGCAFDAAGNLYVVTPTDKRLLVFTMPNLDNTFTTRRSAVEEDPFDAVVSVRSESARPTKMIRDGQLIILREGEQYNAQGVKQ